MKILVTGGSGFLGRHLIESLLDEGHEVTNFSRSLPKDLAVNTTQGDLSKKEDVYHALKGQEAVFHLASKVGIWGSEESFHKTNVGGTENVIQGCLAEGIKKLVFTSSPSVVFGKDSLCGVDEAQEFPKEYISSYAKTKGLAEKLVLKANGDQLATVALRPHLIFGPGDQHIFPRIVSRAKSGKLRRVGDGKNLVDVIYVKNAVDAHIAAFKALDINSRVAGKAYFIGQEKPVNLWDFIDDVLTRNKVNPITSKISKKTAYGLGWLLEKGYGLFGLKREPPMTRFMALQLSCSHYYSHKRAEEDFGYFPKVSTKNALDETVRL